MPEDLTGLPDAAARLASPDPVAEARERIDLGDEQGALVLLDAHLSQAPRDIDAIRVRQDLLRGRGRVGLVFVEAERRLVEWGENAESLYLMGRIQRRNEDKRAWFERTLEADPRSFWGWLGLAFTWRAEDRLRSLQIYRDLYDRSHAHPLVAVALASVLRASRDEEETELALGVYRALRLDPQWTGIADLGIAETMLARGQRPEAWAPFLTALRARPFDPGVRGLTRAFLGQGLTEEQVAQILDVLYEDPQRLEQFAADEGAPLLAKLFERVSHIPAARAQLATAGDRLNASAARHRRRLALGVGDVVGYLATLRATVPLDLVRAEANRVRGRWVALLDGPWSDAGLDPLRDPATAVDLTRAMLRAGLLDEADLFVTLALTRHPDAAGLTALQTELRREISFEGAVRRVLYRGYRIDGEGSLDETLEALRGVSLRILGEDVVGQPGVSSIPMVGQMIDPFTGRLADHLARYNRHLVLGQRWGGTVEGLLLNRLSVRELEYDEYLPLDGRCVEVVGDDRQIQTASAVLGGDLAGVALLDHYVIDYDAVRDWAAALLRNRRTVREDGGAVLDDPLPTAVDPLEPVDATWRLVATSTVADADLEAAVFDMVAAHERAHLVDSFYYLPPGSNLWRVLGLVFAHFFDPLSIESEMEGRAEAGALARSPHTHLVLAHVASFLESTGTGSPHAIGFRRLAERIVEALGDDPTAQVRRWHEADPAKMRQIARRILSER